MARPVEGAGFRIAEQATYLRQWQIGLPQVFHGALAAHAIGSFGMTAYCGSKFALVGLTEALRLELKPRNISVQLACPGEFDTPMTQQVNAYRTNENRVITHTVPVLSLQQVADEVFAGIEAERFLTIPGGMARLLEWVNHSFPGLMRRVLDAKLKKIFVGPEV